MPSPHKDVEACDRPPILLRDFCFEFLPRWPQLLQLLQMRFPILHEP